MGSSAKEHEDDAFREEEAELESVRRLSVLLCVLIATAIASFLTFSLMRSDEEKRLVQASKLAQDELERVTDDREPLGATNFPFPFEERLAAPTNRERYSREVEIAPGAGDTARASVTVTVGWKTMGAGTRVKMHGRLGSKPAARMVSGVGQ